MEYSTDNSVTWNALVGGGFQELSNLVIGDRIWARKKENTAEKRFLGEVNDLTGPDFYPSHKFFIGEGYWTDKIYGKPGEEMKIHFYMNNIGNMTNWNSAHQIRFYLSEDKEITTNDIHILDFTYPYTIYLGERYGSNKPFTIPANLLPGTYYIGYIMDATNLIPELNEYNNTTSPETVSEIIVKNPTTLNQGAFKIVNSWGLDSRWENKVDGHYWMPYEVLKNNQMLISYYFNNFDNSYQPTILLVFQMTHEHRNEFEIYAGLGDPENPYQKKVFSTAERAGAHAFPANKMAMDISEFAFAINDYDLFIKIVSSSTTEGVINSSSVEFYENYNETAFTIIEHGSSVSIPAGETTIVYLNTKVALNQLEEASIIPLPRSAANNNVSFTERIPSALEIEDYKARYGVHLDGVNYNIIQYGKYGTGFVPPKLEAWNNMRVLKSVENLYLPSGELPNHIDHSQTKYFPPIGNQGDKGSCASFALVYYIQTFTEAKEHDWDLSDVQWVGDWPGHPDSKLDKIFSPDFTYNQTNKGVDNGSSHSSVISIITRLGGVSWGTMPYTIDDYTSWPSEQAFREAPLYRGKEVAKSYWSDYSAGYFIIKDDSDIDLLKRILAAGYLVSTSINTENIFLGKSDPHLDNQDVIITTDGGPKWTLPNHAQTIVGYKEGSVWNPAHPD